MNTRIHPSADSITYHFSTLETVERELNEIEEAAMHDKDSPDGFYRAIALKLNHVRDALLLEQGELKSFKLD